MEKTKMKAILIGGPHDRQTYELDEQDQKIAIVSRVLKRNGEWKECSKATYRLKSKGPPLEYEFEPN